MILKDNFPRATVFWILLAQSAVFFPHIANVPIWLSAIFFSCLAWRFGIYQGRWSYPGKIVKIILFVSAFAGVFASFQTITGAKGGVALLLIAFAYKSLEMKEKRDAYLVIMLAYFVVACAFLFQRSFFSAAYLLLCTLIISSALVSMNTHAKEAVDLKGLWLSSKIMLQAIPLMVFLFLFFPQLPPLFQMNLGNEEAKTGLSDSMSPGSISDLTRSGELAFRVTFEGEAPLQSELYWRAQVFERFDGITWRMFDKAQSELTREDIIPTQQGKVNKESLSNKKVTVDMGRLFTYTILQEPSEQNLLFSLPTPWSDNPQIKLNKDFSLTKTGKLDSLFSYQVTTNPNYIKNKTLTDFSRSSNLRLPNFGNDQAKALAQQLRQQSLSDLDYFNKVKAYFLNQPLSYTLSPPKLGANPVDEFVFDTQQGFCEHFASSFVYIMRAGGVPARAVGGYLGGEYNENGNYFLIHQYDAHAWSEIWIEGQGWIRVDPTAWIAPDRVNRGIQESLSNGESILSGSLLNSRKYNPLTTLRLQFDYLNMKWDQLVLGYDEEMQAKLFETLLGRVTPGRIALFMAVCFSLVILVTSLSIYLKDFFRIKDPVDRLYFTLQKRLAKKGYVRKAYESPSQFSERVLYEVSEVSDSGNMTKLNEQKKSISNSGDVKKSKEEFALALSRFTQLYSHIKYNKQPLTTEASYSKVSSSDSNYKLNYDKASLKLLRKYLSEIFSEI